MSLGKKKKEKKSSPKIFVLKNAFIEITIFNGPPLEFRIRAWLSLLKSVAWQEYFVLVKNINWTWHLLNTQLCERKMLNIFIFIK